MKNIELHPINILIAVVYCLFGVMSFFVLKIAAKYFMKQNNQQGSKKGTNSKKVSRKYLQQVNISRVFIKTYLIKNTLIGSIINQDKKYLMKQIFVLSCIAVSCFNINTYLIWPWTIGFGTSIVTLIVSQIIIPIISNSTQQILSVDNSEVVSNLNENSSLGSLQIEINTRLEIILSSQRDDSTSKRIEQKPKVQLEDNYQNCQLYFILVLALISQILLSFSVLKLSLSVSNSGILNMVSLGIAVLIDQFGARIGFALISYVLCSGLHKLKIVNLLENKIFYSFCQQALIKDLRRVHEESQIEAKNKKIANLIQLQAQQKNDTGAKMINQNSFAYQEKVQGLICIPNNLPKQALLDEQQQDQQQSKGSEVQAEKKTNKKLKFETQIDMLKQETNYFELYPYDIKTFTEPQSKTQRQHDKVKKFQKRLSKPQQKFKSDHLLYLPFEQHKLTTHRNSVKNQINSFKNSLSLFDNDKTSMAEDFLKNIEVLECLDDSLATQQEAQIGTVLNQKNLNIKNLTINQKAHIPPTSRPNYSATKRSGSKDSIGVKKIKKVSPYLVNLPSQAVKPQNSKEKKPLVSKINKQNANQTNQSLMRLQTIDLSRVNKKELRAMVDWRNNENVNMAQR